METWYKINLTPLAPFFWGQETIAELGNRQSYFQRSAIFPQQTTLLGLLRYQLQLQYGLVNPVTNNNDDPKDIIGNMGFDPSVTEPNYGKIKQLSPVFLQNNFEGHYFLFDKEHIIDKDSYSEIRKSTNSFEFISLGTGSPKSFSNLVIKDKGTDYISKNIFAECLRNIENGSNVLLSDIIREATQVGVYKWVTRGNSDDESSNAYFKFIYRNMGEMELIKKGKGYENSFNREQTKIQSIELVNNWSFAFYCLLNEDILNENKRPVLMGKERSPFVMSTTKIVDTIENPIITISNSKVASGEKIVLLSDAFIGNETEILNNSDLILGSTVPFRSFTVPVNNFTGHRIPAKSIKHNLLKRGSVIFTSNCKQVKEYVEENHVNWKNIGYNYVMNI